MDGVSFEDGEDEFVVVSVDEERVATLQASFDPLGADQADEANHRRSRSRSRADSATRRQRQQQAEIEKSSSTVLLVSNLRANSHDPFRARLEKEIPAGHLKEVHLHKEHNFGFLVFSKLETMNEALRKLSDCEINGAPISLSRCAAVTLWRNPRVVDDESPCDTLAVKSFPQEITMPILRAELKKLATVEPIEMYFQVSPSGTFSGTIIMRFASVEAAQTAHAFFNSITMLGRQVRAEFKRPDTRAVPRLYHPPCRETEMLFARLKEFKSSAGQSLVLTTKMMTFAVREQLVSMVAYLGLRAISDGETPRTQLTILRPLEDRPISRASAASSYAASRDCTPSAPASHTSSATSSRAPSVVAAARAPRGPDGTRGFRPAVPLTAATVAASPTPRDSGLDGARSAALLAQMPSGRSASGTWRRRDVVRRLTGTS